ncbi:unnamed protein product [Amoebophrya sp. A25]|nr:unnamed protein product [Amoebophrya sp. A25]|eukprot:GSA25T00018200001.1
MYAKLVAPEADYGSKIDFALLPGPGVEEACLRILGFPDLVVLRQALVEAYRGGSIELGTQETLRGRRSSASSTSCTLISTEQEMLRSLTSHLQTPAEQQSLRSFVNDVLSQEDLGVDVYGNHDDNQENEINADNNDLGINPDELLQRLWAYSFNHVRPWDLNQRCFEHLEDTFDGHGPEALDESLQWLTRTFEKYKHQVQNERSFWCERILRNKLTKFDHAKAEKEGHNQC